MNLKNAQIAVDNWIKEHGVRYFNELTNMAQLTEEVGEVARIIARRYGEQSEKESDKAKDLGEELAAWPTKPASTYKLPLIKKWRPKPSATTTVIRTTLS